jgi:hypothetical protein
LKQALYAHATAEVGCQANIKTKKELEDEKMWEMQNLEHQIKKNKQEMEKFG